MFTRHQSSKGSRSTDGLNCLLLCTVLLIGSVSTTGCDFLEIPADTILLPATSVEFCFRFDRSTAGQNQMVVSEDAESLEAFLRSEGYALTDVVAASVTEGRAQFTFPLSENFGLFSDAEVGIRGAGRDVGVTSAWKGEGARDVALPVDDAQDIAAAISSGNFQGFLSFTGARSTQGALEVTVRLTIQVEVEGV